MTKAEAIDILSDELSHTRFHLQEKGKAPEFYKELGDYCDALQMAIDALKNNSEKKEKADATEQKPASAEWISLGYRPGPFKHPFSEDYKCSACGHEVYTLMWTPPEYCPACRSFMKNGGMRFVESLETDGGKPDER